MTGLAIMLDRAHRLCDGITIRTVSRRGRKIVGKRLVMHVACGASQVTPRVCVIVNKAVGNSVVRHRIRRRVTEILRTGFLDRLVGLDVVVRARPSAATSSFRELRAECEILATRISSGPGVVR